MADVETDADRRAILRKLITAAKRGEPWAQQLYHDRKFGKAVQPVQHSGDDTNPIRVALHWETPSADD